MLERNVGQSDALAAGLRHARGAILITMDADGQNDPAGIPALLDALAAVAVAGVRPAELSNVNTRDDLERAAAESSR